MEKRTKIILIVLGVLILVLLLWLLNRYFGSRQPQEEQEYNARQYPLRYGSRSKRGTGVETLQRVCNDVLQSFKDYKTLATDGIWGDKTEAAVYGLLNFSLSRQVSDDMETEELHPFEPFIQIENGMCVVKDVEDFNSIVRMAQTYTNPNIVENDSTKILLD